MKLKMMDVEGREGGMSSAVRGMVYRIKDHICSILLHL